jgi:hypothetical protein
MMGEDVAERRVLVAQPFVAGRQFGDKNIGLRDEPHNILET